MTPYWTQLRYQGQGGAQIELRFDARNHWSYRFWPEAVWFFGGRSKFDAMLKASHHCGRSMQDMDWKAVREEAA